MPFNLQKRNRSLFAAILAVITLCIALASAAVFSQQKNLLIEALMRKAESEVDLIGATLTDAMLRNDYSEGRRLLADWRGNNPSVARLDVVFDNGTVFFSYNEKPTETDVISTQSKSFAYAGRSLEVTITLCSTEMSQTLRQLRRNLIALSMFLMILMGGALWFVLFRWMITPMEQEIAQRTRDLQTAKDTLEDQVRERTVDLSQEISVRKDIEDKLRKLVRAVEQSPVLVFITDTGGVIEYVNPKFEQVTGYSSSEVIGQKPSILKFPDTPKEVHDDLWNTILRGEDWINEIQDRRKDGTAFWANAHISPIRDEDGRITHYISLHEDITERKAAEVAMNAARRAAELSNQAKTDLMANMSHELRTPLNAIIGFSETMKYAVFGPLGNAHYQEYADYIHSSGTHLLSLINDILDVSSVEAGKLDLKEEPTDVAEVCEVAVRIMSSKAIESGVKLHGITKPDLPLLMADPLRLKQIFINLVSNAVKFTPDGGTVSCDARLNDDGTMIVTVSDTGIGMDETGKAVALEKFGQVDSSLSRKHEGTGLGLPLTKGLIDLHGGTLEIDSHPGKGTEVTVHFPVSRVLKPDTRPEPDTA
ncbi:receiver/sensor box histidine kinase [Magnetovibrio blakemorei]|uniref:histidine kinase n=1 Tax=Magnetovibrio blakemorei TaxID=28181 RepID=A0A1E5Q5W0_9PROT|nr:PAS domain S-box protein [Magnetovibrio blakemorei]OEJ65693.1 hypothetical protein BEN30_13665 [Magnetovibrio blakemorei]